MKRTEKGRNNGRREGGRGEDGDLALESNRSITESGMKHCCVGCLRTRRALRSPASIFSIASVLRLPCGFPFAPGDAPFLSPSSPSWTGAPAILPSA